SRVASRLTSLLVFLLCAGSPRHLHSFPTRRSSDLRARQRVRPRKRAWRRGAPRRRPWGPRWRPPGRRDRRPRTERKATSVSASRSEEHTSELQSLAYLVCRLLLEKKNLATHIPSHL